MEDYDKKIREIVESLSPEEKNILKSVLKIESKYKQTLHKILSDTIVHDIQKAIEGSVK